MKKHLIILALLATLQCAGMQRPQPTPPSQRTARIIKHIFPQQTHQIPHYSKTPKTSVTTHNSQTSQLSNHYYQGKLGFCMRYRAE